QRAGAPSATLPLGLRWRGAPLPTEIEPRAVQQDPVEHLPDCDRDLHRRLTRLIQATDNRSLVGVHLPDNQDLRPRHTDLHRRPVTIPDDVRHRERRIQEPAGDRLCRPTGNHRSSFRAYVQRSMTMRRWLLCFGILGVNLDAKTIELSPLACDRNNPTPVSKLAAEGSHRASRSRYHVPGVYDWTS